MISALLGGIVAALATATLMAACEKEPGTSRPAPTERAPARPTQAQSTPFSVAEGHSPAATAHWSSTPLAPPSAATSRVATALSPTAIPLARSATALSRAAAAPATAAWRASDPTSAYDPTGEIRLGGRPPAAGLRPRRACAHLVNHTVSPAIRQIAAAPDGGFVALFAGSAGGGAVPVRAKGPTLAGALLPLSAAQGGGCRALSVEPEARFAIGICAHDAAQANPDSGEELWLFDLDRAGAWQLSRRDDGGGWTGSVAVDAAGRRVAYVSGGSLRLADVVTGMVRLLGPMTTVADGAFLRLTPAGDVLLAGEPAARTVSRLVPATGERRDFVATDGDLDASGQRVALGIDGQILLWDVGTDAPVPIVGPVGARFPRLDGAGRRVAFVSEKAPPDAAAPSAPPPYFALLDLPSGRLALHPAPGAVLEFDLSDDGLHAWARVAVGSGQRLIRLEVETGVLVEVARWDTLTEIVDLSGDGRLAVVEDWTAGTASARLVPASGGAPVAALPFSGVLDATGARVAAFVLSSPDAPARRLRVHEVATGITREIAAAERPRTEPTSGPGVLLSADGRRAAYVAGGMLRLVDVETGAVATLADGLPPLAPLALDASGDRVAFWSPGVGGDRPRLFLHHVPSGHRYVVAEASTPGTPLAPLALTPAGHRLAFCVARGYDASCRLSLADLDDEGAPRGAPRSWIGLDVGTSLAISDDGDRLTWIGAAPGMRGLLRLDVATSRLTRLLPRVMWRAIVRGDTCAFQTTDGGAVVALPAQ